MPSQSSFEGDGTFDHLISTTSPDLERVLGAEVSVAGADRDWVGARRRRRRRKRGIIVMVVKIFCLSEETNDW